ncbi:hypothetical protein KIN20_035871 [Parelaphostrongylus tenuis]|uniref:Uncharacterized protein n=1 Tax=Parelaphostrongylus tenuis TaxID=148309 RepID=A0AAD5RF97_PARTN|nr:hypothetical protein KIN20_035871 [Parelaphostrongylus tenuis]
MLKELHGGSVRRDELNARSVRVHTATVKMFMHNRESVSVVEDTVMFGGVTIDDDYAGSKRIRDALVSTLHVKNGNLSIQVGIVITAIIINCR